MFKSVDDYKIVLHNSAIIVNDYTWGECITLENYFANWDPVRHTRDYIGIYYDKATRRLFLPRGIDVDLVKRKVQSNMIEPVTTNIIHHYKYAYNSRALKMKLPPRNDEQLEAIKFILCKDKYEKNLSKSQFGLSLLPGKGKTYIASCAIVYTGVRTMVITSQSGILEQWKQRLKQYTDIRDSDICKIEGSPTIDRMINGKSTEYGKMVYLCTHSTLQMYGAKYGWDKVGKLFEVLGIGIKIFDEAHQNFDNMSLIDFAARDVWRTYYLTATPARSDTRENQIYKVYMKNVPNIALFNEETDPHTKYIAIKYNSLPRPSDIAACKTNIYGLSNPLYVNKYLIRNDRFWTMFDYIFNLIYISGGRALFYIATNDGIEKVRQRILMNYPELRYDVGIYSSINIDKQSAKEKKYILTTMKSAGAGEDILHLKYSVVLAEPFKSEVLAMQSLGRTRDDDTTYIELVDVGFKQIVSYYNAKKHVFSKYATECKNYLVDNPRLSAIKEDTRISMRNRFSIPIERNVWSIEGVKFIGERSFPGVYFIESSKNITQ